MNEAPVIETNRTTRHFMGRSAGHNNGTGVTIIGPVLVTIDVIEYESHTSSYYVTIDGRHQFGGFAHHMRDGLPSAGFLEIGAERAADVDPFDGFPTGAGGHR